MKKVFIKLICLLLVVMCVCAITNCVDASTAETIKGTFGGASDSPGTGAAKQILSAVLSVVRNVGAAVAVVTLMVIGAKYIVASAGDRADIKKYAINYVIGAVILLGASGILTVVKTIVDESLK